MYSSSLEASLDEPLLEFDSLQKSYYTISSLGFGTFGFAILAKAKRGLGHFLVSNPSKRGTMMEPVSRHSACNLYGNGLVAVKIMKELFKRPQDYLLVNEVKFILSVPSHENLLQIFSVFVDSHNGRLNIVMEPMDQNLLQFIQKSLSRALPEWVTKSILAQLMNAIRHIHKLGFFHRDVKPENILLLSASHYYGGRLKVPPDREHDLYVVKLCDYGLARHASNAVDLTPYVSTRWYRAPEILLRLQKYLYPIDIWAFGCVAVELAIKRPLFCGKNESEQLWEIMKVLGHPLNASQNDIGGKWTEGIQLAAFLGFCMPFTLGSSIHSILTRPEDTELANAIKRCFMWDPDLRPTANEIAKCKYFEDSILNDTAESPLPSLSCENLFDDYKLASNYLRECRSDNDSLLAHIHHNHGINAYSDPIVSGISEDGTFNSIRSTMADTLEANFFEKYTTLRDNESDGFSEKPLFDAGDSESYKNNVSFSDEGKNETSFDSDANLHDCLEGSRASFYVS